MIHASKISQFFVMQFNQFIIYNHQINFFFNVILRLKIYTLYKHVTLSLYALIVLIIFFLYLFLVEILLLCFLFIFVINSDEYLNYKVKKCKSGM